MTLLPSPFNVGSGTDSDYQDSNRQKNRAVNLSSLNPSNNARKELNLHLFCLPRQPTTLTTGSASKSWRVATEAPPPPWYPAWQGECIPDKTTPPIEGATPAAVRTSSSSSRMVLAPPVSRAMHPREVVAGIPSWPCDCGPEYLMVYQTHCHGNALNCCLPARAMYCHWQ